MSDELSPEMLEEAAPDLLTLEDEDGKEVTFEVIDATEVNGTPQTLAYRPKICGGGSAYTVLYQPTVSRPLSSALL